VAGLAVLHSASGKPGKPPPARPPDSARRSAAILAHFPRAGVDPAPNCAASPRSPPWERRTSA